MQGQIVDEILEIIWMRREKGEDDLTLIEADIKCSELDNLLEPMENGGLVEIKDKKVFFTDKGEEKATGLLRRHRLAERLLIDVLDSREDEIEEPACQFEHILSEEVTDGICTLLGHPKVCPHGLPIPEGNCCKNADKMIESLVVPLTKIKPGEWVTVAYILMRQHPRLNKLTSFGITPGTKIKLCNTYPAYIIQVEETQIALEEELIKDIFVRRK